MNINEFLKVSKNYEKTLKEFQKKYVVVGILKENDNVSQGAYAKGVTVVEVGASHEFGIEHLPKRSFLRVPFNIEKNKINNLIDNEFDKLFNQNKSTLNISLNKIGILATNISKKAFTSSGYGTWQPLSKKTILKKTKGKGGNTQILIDTGVLRNSISWQVREE